MSAGSPQRQHISLLSIVDSGDLRSYECEQLVKNSAEERKVAYAQEYKASCAHKVGDGVLVNEEVKQEMKLNRNYEKKDNNAVYRNVTAYSQIQGRRMTIKMQDLVYVRFPGARDSSWIVVRETTDYVDVTEQWIDDRVRARCFFEASWKKWCSSLDLVRFQGRELVWDASGEKVSDQPHVISVCKIGYSVDTSLYLAASHGGKSVGLILSSGEDDGNRCFSFEFRALGNYGYALVANLRGKEYAITSLNKKKSSKTNYSWQLIEFHGDQDCHMFRFTIEILSSLKNQHAQHIEMAFLHEETDHYLALARKAAYPSPRREPVYVWADGLFS